MLGKSLAPTRGTHGPNSHAANGETKMECLAAFCPGTNVPSVVHLQGSHRDPLKFRVRKNEDGKKKEELEKLEKKKESA